MTRIILIVALCLVGCGHVEFDMTSDTLEEAMEDSEFERILDEAEKETDTQLKKR